MKDRLGLGIDFEADGDQIVDYEGTKLLLAEENLAGNFEELSIDVEETPDGAKLVINKV